MVKLEKLPRFFVVSGLLLIVGLWSSPAWSVPMSINVQGKLNPVPADGQRITFHIHDSADAETGLLYTEVMTVIRAGIPNSDQVLIGEDGIFNAILRPAPAPGSVMPDFASDGDYFLEVYAGTAKLAPRQRLVAVPMAITAKTVSGPVNAFRLATETDSNASAVAGTNNRNAGGADVLALNPGVAGTSAQGYGVVGVKLDDADNDQKAAILGSNLETNGSTNPLVLNPGVLGQSSAGYGVLGWVSNANKAGVFGYNATPAGVLQGVGVFGWGTTGVYGKGTTAGGSFESTGISGYGVIGKGMVAGVRGEGLTTGGVGVSGISWVAPYSGVEGISTAGDGVYGYSSGVGRAGVKADSTMTGTALEVGSGMIKVARTDGKAYRSSGVVTMAADEFSKTVYNSLVDDNSIIILTKQRVNPRTTAGEIFYVGGRSTGVGFSIARYVIVPGVSDVENIGYLIIN